MDNTKPVLAHFNPVPPTDRVVHLTGSRHRRIYIAGPMTGLPEFNFPLFNATAAGLRELAYHVENPAEHGHVEHAEWADYLRYDIGRMVTCESIFLLPGWEKSNGARLEVYVAQALGMVFIHHADAKYVTQVEANDLEVLEAAYIRAGEREHELRLLLVERNETIAGHLKVISDMQTAWDMSLNVASHQQAELAALREYRNSAIGFSNSHGEGYSLQDSNAAEARLEAAEKACWDFYRAAPVSNSESAKGERVPVLDLLAAQLFVTGTAAFETQVTADGVTVRVLPDAEILPTGIDSEGGSHD